MTKIETATLIRIPRAKARKLYEAGTKVMFCPVKMNPESPWKPGAWLHHTTSAPDFERVCNAFKYYNCTKETGNYIAFYIQKGV